MLKISIKFHCVLVLRVHRLRQLLPLYSRRGFCSHGAALGTPVLRYNRCATPAKLPFCKCPVRLQIVKWKNKFFLLTKAHKLKNNSVKNDEYYWLAATYFNRQPRVIRILLTIQIIIFFYYNNIFFYFSFLKHPERKIKIGN